MDKVEEVDKCTVGEVFAKELTEASINVAEGIVDVKIDRSTKKETEDVGELAECCEEEVMT
jgi:uncharacterized protein (UPF0218 family)